MRLGRSGLEGQPALSRHHELRPAHERGRQPRHHGPGARARHQLLRHRERLRLEDGRRRHRADRRALVRAGRRAPRAGRPRDQGLRADGRAARTISGLSARHIRDACDASLRRLQTDHIDLYQMHHVDRTTPWDEIWQAMEHARARRERCSTSARATSPAGRSRRRRPRRRAPFPRPRLGAEPLQPHDAHDRARGAARVPRATASASSRGARSRAARSPACSAHRGKGRRSRDLVSEEVEQAPAADSRPGSGSARERGDDRPNVALAWTLAHPAVTAPIIGSAHDGAARRARVRALDVRLDDGGARSGSTRSGPGPAARRPRRTPGDPPFVAGAAATPARLPQTRSRLPAAAAEPERDEHRLEHDGNEESPPHAVEPVAEGHRERPGRR